MTNAFLLSILFLLAPVGRAQQTAYVGAGGCNGSNCHGGVASPESRILGNEYAIWFKQDKHKDAYKVLEDARAKRMGEILRITVTTDRRCTVCHVVGSPANSKTDGVACEACHGPAEKWLGGHKQPNSHAASVAQGMTDTKDLKIRAQTCLECHLGKGEKIVDHELIAAGHPDLNFELDTFTAAQKSHHREPRPSAGNTLPRVRVFAVGQAVAFAEGMRQLATDASKNWPEFSDLECYQCHHDLRADSWRIARGYAGRKPGTLQPNLARFEVLRVLVAQAAPDRRAALDAAFGQVESAVGGRFADGGAIARAAQAAAGIGDSLAGQMAAQDFNQSTARAIIKAMSADIARISGAGVHSAEVATLALDSLLNAVEPQRTQATAELYNYLEHPSLYEPAKFAAVFRKVAGN